MENSSPLKQFSLNHVVQHISFNSVSAIYNRPVVQNFAMFHFTEWKARQTHSDLCFPLSVFITSVTANETKLHSLVNYTSYSTYFLVICQTALGCSINYRPEKRKQLSYLNRFLFIFQTLLFI